MQVFLKANPAQTSTNPVATNKSPAAVTPGQEPTTEREGES